MTGFMNKTTPNFPSIVMVTKIHPDGINIIWCSLTREHELGWVVGKKQITVHEKKKKKTQI